MNLLNQRNSEISSIYEHPFPVDQAGVVIDDIDIEILASDSIRIIDAYLKKNELSSIQQRVMNQCLAELEIVVESEDINTSAKTYFQNILHALFKVKKSMVHLEES